MTALKVRRLEHARIIVLLLLLETVIGVLLPTFSTAHAQCGEEYLVEVIEGPDCGLLPSSAIAHGIAENGELCGIFQGCDKYGYAFEWFSSTGITIIQVPPGFHGASALDINSNSQAVGIISSTILQPSERAFLSTGGVAINLGVLPGGNRSEGYGINEAGVACGLSANSVTGPLQAFIYQGGQMSALNLPLGPNSNAFGIADDGTICGWMGGTPSTGAHAFIWKGGITTDLGAVLKGAVGAEALALSNGGSVCGRAIYPDPNFTIKRHGFLWTDGNAIDLGHLRGFVHCTPQGVNSSNVVVGFCHQSAMPTTAFVWRNGVMTALNDLIDPNLNLDIDIAHAINDAGQIAGQADVLDGSADRVAVRLSPIPSPIGDSDCDDDIDTDDLLGVINNWAHESPKGSNALPPCDFDHDGLVELDDLMIVIDNWSSN
jgi:uncharacterized membrane protein